MIDIIFLLVIFFTNNALPYVDNTYFLFIVSFTWFISACLSHTYKRKYIKSVDLFLKKSIVSFIYFSILIELCLYFIQQIFPKTLSLSIFLLSILIAIAINRTLYVIIYKYFRKKRFLLDKVIVLGFNELSKKIIHSLEKDEINKQVIGICEESANVQELFHYPILSNLNNAFEACKRYGITEIYSTIAPEKNPHIYKLIQQADQNCIHFKIVPDTGWFINRKCYIDYIDTDIPVISLRKEPLLDLSYRIQKRVFDIIFSLLVLLFVLSWLIPLASLIIWLESKGPIFFIQARSGKGNANFFCVKFRSMRENEFANEKQATRDDERFTRIGKFLRRTNLDEFPQFLNVLRGEMSVVGPRPHMLKHTEEFSQRNNQYMIRHFLKPGITGWAQVNGYRGEITSNRDLQRRIEHDLWYLENWSMWLDMKIIFRTIINTFKGEKNAF
jgi:putative colanic acid biosynthesis UDP-glucose lipid carrier transferase